jgi:hypothetical protein
MEENCYCRICVRLAPIHEDRMHLRLPRLRSLNLYVPPRDTRGKVGIPRQHQPWGQQPSQKQTKTHDSYDLAPNMGAGSGRTDNLSVQERDHLGFPEEVEETLAVSESSEGGEGGGGGEVGVSEEEGETQMGEEMQVEEDPQPDEVVGHHDGGHNMVSSARFYIDASGKLKRTFWTLRRASRRRGKPTPDRYEDSR